jgi:hypothetical protein
VTTGAESPEDARRVRSTTWTIRCQIETQAEIRRQSPFWRTDTQSGRPGAS